MQKYESLHALLQSDAKARQLFAELPDYVKMAALERSAHINSLDSLYSLRDNMTQGDG